MFVFLKNQNNYTKKQKEKYEEIKISKLNIKTFRAMQIREAFQQLYLCKDMIYFEDLLKKWYGGQYIAEYLKYIKWIEQ